MYLFVSQCSAYSGFGHGTQHTVLRTLYAVQPLPQFFTWSPLQQNYMVSLVKCQILHSQPSKWNLTSGSDETFLIQNTHGEIKQAWYAYRHTGIYCTKFSQVSMILQLYIGSDIRLINYVCISKRSFWSYFGKYFHVGINRMLGLQVTTWQRKRVGRSKFFVHSSCSSLIGFSTFWTLKPRPCCIDLTMTQSIQQGLGLRFASKDLTLGS